MTGVYEAHVLSDPAGEIRVTANTQHGATHLAFDFPDIVVDAEVMTFSIHGDGSLSVPPHGDLVRLDHTDLAILIKDTEGVSLSLDDVADCVITGDDKA